MPKLVVTKQGLEEEEEEEEEQLSWVLNSLSGQGRASQDTFVLWRSKAGEKARSVPYQTAILLLTPDTETKTKS